jgi:hypothetical protein
MSSSEMQLSLPSLLVEFEKLILLWAEHPEQCDRERLKTLNVSTWVFLHDIHI